MSAAEVHCWEDGQEHGMEGHTCFALDGHVGEHDWVSDDQIFIDFK